jgi:hypothetical protein
MRHGRHDLFRLDMVRQVQAGVVLSACRVKLEPGKAGKVTHVWFRRNAARHVGAGEARFGRTRHGLAGEMRWSTTGSGVVSYDWKVEAWQAW